MKVDNKVPFYSNTPDDTHCVQACYRMVLKYFLPDEEYSWEELDKASAKQKRMWTWPMAGLCWLKQKGFEVINIEDFDYERLIKYKKKYLIEKYGQEAADEQDKHSNIEAEMVWARRFIKDIKPEDRKPEVEEIKKFLDESYLVLVSLNYNSLYGQDGYTGHMVLIKGYDEDGLIIHDPGNPGIASKHVGIPQFIRGWSYPDDGANNLMALKLGNNG